MKNETTTRDESRKITPWKTTINGSVRYGWNEKRYGGVYTVGPHNGFETRREAVAWKKRTNGGAR